MQRTVRGVVAAGLCNALFAPVGYFVAGAYRIGVGVCAAVFVLGGLALLASVWRPPGVYGLSGAQRLDLQLGAMALFGAHAAWLASRTESRRPFLLRLGAGLLAAVVLLGVGLLARAFWPVSIYSVASGSMRPSLEIGDVVAVDGVRVLCGHSRPRPGQVAVYLHPGSTSRYMHRVVAGPGQSVVVEGTDLIVDGRKVVEQAARTRMQDGADGQEQVTVASERIGAEPAFKVQHLRETAYSHRRSYTLGADQWFLMGDNREDALDSRSFGPVRSKDLCGIGIKVLRAGDVGRVGSHP